MAHLRPAPGSASENRVPVIQLQDTNRFEWCDTAPSDLSKMSSSVCDSCQSLLLKPECNPHSQNDLPWNRNIRFFIRIAVSEASSKTAGGCVICKLVMAALPTVTQDGISVDQVHGFKLGLYWLGDGFWKGSKRFDRIDVFPVDHLGKELYTNGELHGIKLDLEEASIGRELYCSSPSHTGSQSCGNLAKRWLRKCIAHHPRCRKESAEMDWLPTRLIDVGMDASLLEPRLVLTSEFESQKDADYTTLSHRWTSSGILKLESSTVDSFRQRIPLETLPSTFFDAMKTTRSLGFRYIWIDSLCIMQDCLTDWQLEAAEMGRVYRNCVCNLAATGAADNLTNGFFQARDPQCVDPASVRIHYQGHDKIYLASHWNLWGKWVSRSTLNRRGWVLQERMLSPRTIHFTSQLFWECREEQACETYPQGCSSDEVVYKEDDGSEQPVGFKDWHWICENTQFWNDLVCTYGRSAITEPDDRLFAIAGIAKSLQPIYQDEYLAGLWRKDIPYNLAWSLCNVRGQEVQLPERYRAPSWSWASLDYTSALISNPVIFKEEVPKVLVHMVDVCVEPVGSDVFGSLSGGHLILTGRLGRVSRLAEAREGECVQGQDSYFANFDSDLINEDALLCLPLLIRNEHVTKTGPNVVDCLLVETLRPDTDEYKRVGLLNVTLELNHLLPEEMKWIVHCAKDEPCLVEFVTVTIY